jgi:pimeloyl-ACP methyl ester carboxylesterase
MQAGEARALGALAGRAMSGTADFVADVHLAILERSLPRDPAGSAVGAAHRGIAGLVYAAVSGLTHGLGLAAGAGLAATRPADAHALSDSPAGGAALSALSGLYGDLLERDGSALAVRMTLRGPGGAVATDASSLAAAFPDATGRLAVFVHGLGETESAWRLFASAEEPATYGGRLRADLGFTPLYLRYNSGLPVAENGRRLAALLDAIVAAWPVAVDEVALVGHSMGGLVARSACGEGDRRGAAWVAALRHVFCLASPHHGAPLAKGLHAASSALARIPETRALARFLDLRSSGIKDLRFGLDEPFVPGVTYYAVSATVTRDPAHPVGHVVGDLLVRRDSARGQGPRGRRIPFEAGNTHHAAGRNHFHVLNDRGVYDQIRTWLARDALAAPG